jgi:hypothetical protein
MVTSGVTYGQLYRLLRNLDFVDLSAAHPWKVYRHDESGTLILLANREPDSPAQPADVVSVRRHLVDNGLLDPRDFEGLTSSRSEA